MKHPSESTAAVICVVAVLAAIWVLFYYAIQGIG